MGANNIRPTVKNPDPMVCCMRCAKSIRLSSRRVFFGRSSDTCRWVPGDRPGLRVPTEPPVIPMMETVCYDCETVLMHGPIEEAQQVCECRSCKACDGEGGGTRWCEHGCTPTASLPSCPGHDWTCSTCNGGGLDRSGCEIHGKAVAV